MVVTMVTEPERPVTVQRLREAAEAQHDARAKQYRDRLEVDVNLVISQQGLTKMRPVTM